MTYADALEWLYATQLHGIKLGLHNAHRLIEALEIDAARPKFLHVAGTNGKGSVCAMMEAICRAQGLKTGLFTSPHLIRFEERIRINSQFMPKEEIASAFTHMRELVKSWEHHPTFFELTTALALAWFQREKTDVVVLETGLGGRLDATNVVTPAVSVITAIGLDHQAWLGDSLAQIAVEKAGIIKANVPVACLAQSAEAQTVITERARELSAELKIVETPWNTSPVGLHGSHQALNAALAVESLHGAGIAVSEAAIEEGLKNVQWPGRFQVIGNFVLDGAHNPSAAQRLAETWRELFAEQKTTIIFGALGDKDVEGMIAALAPIAERFLLVPTANPRTCTTSELAAFTTRASVPFEKKSSVQDAMDFASAEGKRTLIAGSLFLVGEALAILESKTPPRESWQ